MSHQPLIRQIAGPSLYVGPSASLDDPAAVCAAGVEAVVIVAPERLPDPWPRDLTVMRVPLSDDGGNPPSTLRRVVEVVAGLIRDDVPTLVVCSAGLSRSVAVVATAIAWQTGQSADEVLRKIANDGPADVMPGLWQSLRGIPDVMMDRR